MQTHAMIHASQMSLYGLDHQQIPSFPILWPYHHLGRVSSWSHQSIKLCFRTFAVHRCTSFEIVIPPSDSYYWRVVCLLWYSLYIAPPASHLTGSRSSRLRNFSTLAPRVVEWPPHPHKNCSLAAHFPPQPEDLPLHCTLTPLQESPNPLSLFPCLSLAPCIYLALLISYLSWYCSVW